MLVGVCKFSGSFQRPSRILLSSLVHARLVAELVVVPVQTLSRHTCGCSRRVLCVVNL